MPHRHADRVTSSPRSSASLGVALAARVPPANGLAWSIALAAGVAVARILHGHAARWVLVDRSGSPSRSSRVLSIVKPRAARDRDGPDLRPLQEDPAADLADRAGSARRRQHLVGRGPLHRQARLEEDARLSRGEALGRRAGVHRRPRRRALRHARRVGHHAQPHGPSAGSVEVHPREGLPRHHHPEVVRRARLLRLRALGDRDQDLHAQRHRAR